MDSPPPKKQKTLKDLFQRQERRRDPILDLAAIGAQELEGRQEEGNPNTANGSPPSISPAEHQGDQQIARNKNASNRSLGNAPGTNEKGDLAAAASGGKEASVPQTSGGAKGCTGDPFQRESPDELTEAEIGSTKPDSTMEMEPLLSSTDPASYLRKPLTQDDKYFILKKLWIPEPLYNFPLRKIGNKNRRFNHAWLAANEWLVYSKTKDAAFCKFCLALQLDSQQGGTGGIHGARLVTEGYQNWKRALEDFKNHQTTEFHIKCLEDSQKFLEAYESGTSEVSALQAKSHSTLAERNKLILNAITNIIIFLARQNIPFRGHRDHGRILDTDPDENDGNFRSLLRFIARYFDRDLRDHLESSAANAMMTSPTIQNEIIVICGDLVSRRIVEEVNSAKSFAIIADETTDISTNEQLSVCVCYVHESEHGLSIEEKFMGFSAVRDLSGAALSKSILAYLVTAGVDLSYLRGQSYDEAAAMSSDLVGVKTLIQKEHPLALYTYCSNHALNLVLSDACATTHIRNMIGVVKEVSNFFIRSAKRSSLLKETVQNLCQGERRKAVMKLCETRWVERHEALLRFDDFFEVIVNTFEEIEINWKDREAKSKANSMLKSLCSIDTVLALKSATLLLSLTYPVSQALQEKSCDLAKCYELINNIVSEIENIKENLEEEFDKIFSNAKALCKKLDIYLQIPRLCKRQSHRQSVEGLENLTGIEKVKTYFRETLFCPFVEEFLKALYDRFDGHQSKVCLLLKLLPRNVKECTENDVDAIVSFYETDLEQPKTCIQGEFRLWKRKWTGSNPESLPTTGLEALRACNPVMFPMINRLLKIFCTLPISVASAERTFSCLRRLKTYLRSSMGQYRLSSLALLCMHRNMELQFSDILTEFKRKKERRIILS